MNRLTVALGAILLFSGCPDSSPQQPAPQPAPEVVEKPILTSGERDAPDPSTPLKGTDMKDLPSDSLDDPPK